jgi:phage tail sheath protein FI
MSAFTYPGVYIQELPSGQHNITGVATSIAAFIGWANKGPVGEAVLIESWPEYVATFGGFYPGAYLGYAVYQFFQNLGSQAYIIRLVAPSNGNAGTPPSATAHSDSSVFGAPVYANSPGQWANSVCLNVSFPPGGTGTTFNLQVINIVNGVPSPVETYTNLSVVPTSPNYAVTMIDNDSNYITFIPPIPPGASAPPQPPSAITIPAAATTTLCIPGAVSGATVFNLADPVIQYNPLGTPLAQGTLAILPNNSLPMMVLSALTGPGGTGTPTPNPNFPWTQGAFGSSGPQFNPTALPFQGTHLGAQTAGADGLMLVPGDGNFEDVLLNTYGGAPVAPLTGGYQLLGAVPIFNLLCVPGETQYGAVSALQTFCAQSRAFLIVDSPMSATVNTLSGGPLSNDSVPLTGPDAANSAFYFPWVQAPDPAIGNRRALFPPCGFVAGAYAATDGNVGVWKAPAGINTQLASAMGLQFTLTDLQNGQLNPNAVNCLRQFPIYNTVVWGSRTIAGADAAGSQWQYVPIRRLALFIESSLYQGTQWAVFEPNAEPLWAAVRLSIGSFMQSLFLKGAFAGGSRQQAYFVKCDAENNPGYSVSQGILNITVGFAPLYPAEFVVIQIQQMMNQS